MLEIKTTLHNLVNIIYQAYFKADYSYNKTLIITNLPRFRIISALLSQNAYKNLEHRA